MLYLLFLLKWICSIQKNYFDVKKATFFLSATVDGPISLGKCNLSGGENWRFDILSCIVGVFCCC